MRFIVRLLVGLVVAAAVVSAHQTRAAEIVSYRAEYKLFVGPQDRTGGKSIEENRVQCDAWVQKTHDRIKGGQLMPAQQQVEIRESRDGRKITFSRRISSAVQPGKFLEGSAVQRDGKPPLATFTSPKPRELRLPRGTVFATTFFFRIRRELHASPDKRIARTPVFGILSRSADVYYADARRVKDSGPLFNRVEGDTELLDSPAIDIEVRLFTSPKARKPEHRMVIRFHANGVYSRAIYYLPVGTITSEITRIEALPKAKC